MKALTLSYRDLLHIAGVDETLGNIIELMAKGTCRLTIVDKSLHLKGSISAINVLRYLIRHGSSYINSLLNVSAKELMEPIVTLDYRADVKELIEKIVNSNSGHIVLIDSDSVVRGVITEECIIRRLTIDSKYHLKSSEIASVPVVKLSPFTPLIDACNEITYNNIKRVILETPGQIYGYISVLDIIRFIRGIIKEGKAFSTTVDDVLSENITNVVWKRSMIYVSGNSDILEVISMMKGGREDIILVTLDGNYGVITERDIVIRIPKIIGIEKFIDKIKIE